MAVHEGLHRNWCPEHHRAVAQRHTFHQQQLAERLQIKPMTDSMSVQQLDAAMAVHKDCIEIGVQNTIGQWLNATIPSTAARRETAHKADGRLGVGSNNTTQ